MRLLSLILVLSIGRPAITRAQAAPDRAADSAAVVGVAQDLLRAISTRDTALARRLMLPGAQLASIGDPAGPSAAGRMRTWRTILPLRRVCDVRHAPLALRAHEGEHIDAAMRERAIDMEVVRRANDGE